VARSASFRVATSLILNISMGLNVWDIRENAPSHTMPVEVPVNISVRRQCREHRSRSHGPSRVVEVGRRSNRSRRAQACRNGVRHMSHTSASTEARTATKKVWRGLTRKSLSGISVPSCRIPPKRDPDTSTCLVGPQATVPASSPT
jgi:hypothetical protein